jgi:hypothetical protein
MKTIPTSPRLPILVALLATGLPAGLIAGIQEKESGVPAASLDTGFGMSFVLWSVALLAVFCLGGFMLKKLFN